MRRRRTLEREVSRASVGVHTGEPCVATLRPTFWGAGVVFAAGGGGGVQIPATLEFAEAEAGCTVLRRGSAAVRTPEHLLATLHALGISDVVVVVDGPEVPILDGSAAGWVEAIDEVGMSDGPPLEPYAPGRVVRVDDHGGIAVLGPGSAIAVEVDFGEGGPAGTLRVPLSERAFREEVAWARTFVRAADVERLVAAGRGRGATPDNTVVWPGSPLRSPDEPVRHKLLDAWGDLALLGPCVVELTVRRGSHRLHHAALQALIADR